MPPPATITFFPARACTVAAINVAAPSFRASLRVRVDMACLSPERTEITVTSTPNFQSPTPQGALGIGSWRLGVRLPGRTPLEPVRDLSGFLVDGDERVDAIDRVC